MAMTLFQTHPAAFPRRAAWALALALVVVPLLFGVAMACFPGGYSFSRHVVSDLGRTRLSNGTPNTLSCSLFIAAMTAASLACAFFWLARHTFLTRRAARRVALASGLAMSALMATIGFTPLNLAGSVHDPVTAATAIAAALAILALFADPTDRLERPRVKRAWLILLLLVSAGWTLLVALHHEHVLAFRPWLPLGQKTLIATFISWMVYQTTLLFKVNA
jgi:hypothetical membrane protein